MLKLLHITMLTRRHDQKDSSSPSSPSSNGNVTKGGVGGVAAVDSSVLDAMIQKAVTAAVTAATNVLHEEVKKTFDKLSDRVETLENVVAGSKQQVSSLQQEVSAMALIIEDLRNEVNNKNPGAPLWSEIVHKAVETKFEEVTVELSQVEKSIEESKNRALEMKYREDKRNNIVLFKVPECPPGNFDQIIKHDTDFCMKLCCDILEVDMAREDIKSIYRVGKRGSTPRPLLVHLSGPLLKNRVMQSTYKLRDAVDFKDVVVSHDMTKQEREQCKQLVAEAKIREANDDSGEFIYRVRGPPGEMRIQKIKKRV